MIFHLIVMILWSSGVNLEQFGGHFGAPWAHFEVTLAQAGRSWRQVGPKLAQLGPKFGPKRGDKQIIHISSTYFACQVPGDGEWRRPGGGVGTPGEGYRGA